MRLPRLKKKIFAATVLVGIFLIPATIFAQAIGFTPSESDPCAFDADAEGQDYIELQTQIPGLTQDILVKDPKTKEIIGEKHLVKDFPCFLVGIYKYFAGASAIIATVMMMWGGYKYVISFGSAQKMKDAQDTIVSAMVGLAITLGSYLILYTINPKLVDFPDLIVEPVQPINQGYEESLARQECDKILLKLSCGEAKAIQIRGREYWCCGMSNDVCTTGGCVNNYDEWIKVSGVSLTADHGLCYQGFGYDGLDQDHLTEGSAGVLKYGCVDTETGSGSETLQPCNDPNLKPPNCGSGTGCGASGECIAEVGVCKCIVN